MHVALNVYFTGRSAFLRLRLSHVQFSPNSTWLVTSRHDTFDVSSVSRRACRAVLFDKLDTAKMHGLDTFDVLSPVLYLLMETEMEIYIISLS